MQEELEAKLQAYGGMEWRWMCATSVRRLSSKTLRGLSRGCVDILDVGVAKPEAADKILERKAMQAAADFPSSIVVLVTEDTDFAGVLQALSVKRLGGLILATTASPVIDLKCLERWTTAVVRLDALTVKPRTPLQATLPSAAATPTTPTSAATPTTASTPGASTPASTGPAARRRRARQRKKLRRQQQASTPSALSLVPSSVTIRRAATVAAAASPPHSDSSTSAKEMLGGAWIINPACGVLPKTSTPSALSLVPSAVTVKCAVTAATPPDSNSSTPTKEVLGGGWIVNPACGVLPRRPLPWVLKPACGQC